jgi:tetratricopeptide (TPR) repeat protein
MSTWQFRDSFFRAACVLALSGASFPASAQYCQASGPASGFEDVKVSAACKQPRTSFPSLSTALETVGAQPTAESYERLGTLYGKAGDPECAAEAFTAALALDPDSVMARYSLALALIENHNPQRAETELRTVLPHQFGSPQVHNALGLALQDLGKLDAAAEEFQAALKLNPKFALADYDLAQLLSSQRDYRAATHYLKQGLANAPAPILAVQLKTALAVAYSQLREYDQAIPLFRELISALPQSPDLHFALATAYAHREDYAKAVTEYKEVLRWDSKRYDAELLLAKALLNQSQSEESLSYLRNYVTHKPSDAEGLEVLGEALKNSSHFDEATNVLSDAIKANPSSYKAHYDLGVVLGRSGRTAEAITEVQTALKVKPEASEARYQLAQLLSKLGDRAAARVQFAAFEKLKATEEQQTKAAFLNNQGNDQLRAGRNREAVENFRSAVALAPHDAKLHFNLAIALSRVGDHDGEERELKETLKFDPKFSQAHNELGSLYLAQGQVPAAEMEFRAALFDDPHSPEALNNLGTVLNRQGKNQESEAFFRRAIGIDPEGSLGYVDLGLLLASEGRYSEAEQSLHTALQFDDANETALTALGMLQGKMGNANEAVKTFHGLVALRPNSSAAHINLGIALADRNDLESALSEFSEAERLMPESALALYNRGRILHDLNRSEEAKASLEQAVKIAPNYVPALLLLGVIEHSSARATELFEQVVKIDPSNSQAHFYLGRNLLQEGKRDEAIAQWKRAVEIDPDNKSALSNLARTLTQANRPEAPEYVSRLQALQQKQQVTDRVKELNNFALRSAEGKNWDQAVRQLKEAIDMCGKCLQLGILRKNAGLIYAEQGDVLHAREELERAQRLLPEGPDLAAVRQALEQLDERP